uniref:Type I restriction modification DNA specificity domain-containing protein n=1 Tax=Mycoplasma feriruminatoris TaxID=1179777 RepID=A0A654IM12_9MOLU|nr:hypothetical protein MF5295_00822 [Mycoplasma feriruminatoris]
MGDLTLLNRFPQISAEKLSELNQYKGDVSLLPSSNNNNWRCSYNEKISHLINYAEVITLGRARNPNPKYAKGLFISSQNHIIESKKNDILLNKFLYFFINKVGRKFYSFENTYPMFTKIDFLNTKFLFPSVKEQEKILKVLNNLDSLITLHQWECNFWNLKKFEIKIHRFFTRFCKKSKKYTHTWEQCKVGEIFNIDRGLGITRKDMREIKFGNFKYPVYSSQTSDEGLIGYYTKYMTDNAITWTTDGVKAGTVFYRNHRFFATSHCGLLTKKQFEASQYFSIIISRNTSKYVTWVAMPMLTTSQMEKITIICSFDQKEQYKISSLFSNLDSLITLHQWECNFWNLKKFEIKIHRFFTRFCKKSKKYTHTWEQEKLGVCSYLLNGLIGVSKKDFTNGYDLYIDYLNVFNNTFVDLKSLKTYKNTKKQNYIKYKDVLLTVSSETPEEVAMSSVIDRESNKNIAFNSFCICLRFIKSELFNDKYIGYFFRSRSFRAQAEKMGQGISRFNINQNILKKAVIYYPNNIKEQSNIGKLLHNLDSLITLHQWECNFWNLKKFEIKIHRFFTRFCKKSKKNTHTWEQCKVGEIFNIDRGLGITRKDMREIKFGNFKYPVYSSQTSDEGLIGYYTKYMTDNAITWTTDGVKAGTVFYRNHRFFATSHCGLLTKKQFEASQYFSIIISRNTSKYVTWVAMPMLTTSQMEKITIICSFDQKEQYKISSLFSNLDSLITLHQRGYKWRENIWKKMIYCYTNTFKIE